MNRENILVGENGSVFEFTRDSANMWTWQHAGRVMDGLALRLPDVTATPLQLFQNDEMILEKIELLQQKIDGMDKNNKKFLMAATMNDGRAEKLEQEIVDMKLGIIGLLDQIDILMTAVLSSEAGDLKKGLNSYYGKVVEIASGLGLEAISVAENMKFDSKVMESADAVQLEEYEDDVVVALLQRGYRDLEEY